MPAPDLIARHFRRAQRALIVGTLCVLTASALLNGQTASVPKGQKANTPSSQDSTQPAYAARIKALEDRHSRQLSLGLTDEAARTTQELEALQREQQQKCEGIWRVHEFSQRYSQGRAGLSEKESKAMLKEASELYMNFKNMQLIFACGQRPGQEADQDQLTFGDQAFMRRQVETQGLAVRATLFVEPVLSTTADADISNPMQFGDILLSKLYKELARSAWDLDRTVAALEDILKSEQLSSAATVTALEQLRFYSVLRGDTPAALRYVQRQLDLLQRSVGADSPQLCFPLWQSIPLLLDTQQPDAALAAAQRCERLTAPRGAKSLGYASAMNNLGLVYQRTGSLPLAIDAYQKSVTMVEQIPASLISTVEPTGQRIHITVRANLGLAYWQQGDLASAARHLETARVQMAKEGQIFSTERGAVQSLAKLEEELDALVSLERAVTERSPGQSPLLALPMLLERKGLALEAKAQTVKMFAKDAGNLREYQSLLAYRARLARGTPIQPGSPAAAGLLTGGEAESQLETLEYKARQDAYTAALNARPRDTKDVSRQGDYAAAISREADKLQKEYLKQRPTDDRRSETELLMQFREAARAKVDPQFKDVDPQYKNMVAPTQAVIRGEREELIGRIQQRLPESAVLLEMLHFRPMNVGAKTVAERWQPARYGGYLITHSRRPVFIDFGESGPIDELIVEFRRTLAQPRGTLAHDLGRRLDGILMQPLRGAMGSATTIYLSPDGALNLVPFAALIDEHDRYLIESFTFDYVSSGRDLVRPASPPAATSASAVVVGDPAFDGAVEQLAAVQNGPVTRGLADHRFDRLPGTATEAQAIAGMLRGATLFTGSNATETAIKSVNAPRLLHIATHGFFLADQDLSAATSPGGVANLEDPMLRSGLVFAGANIGRSGADDGVLTALEASGLNLSGTQLVVLSACETGVGEIKTGEGVFGLRRAFMIAGAETLVMSLWQVDDAATQRLMTEFYQRLTKGEGRAEALRQAALTLQRDPAHRHPFYWASFIASGEPTPLRR